MNRIKAHGEATAALIEAVRDHCQAQLHAASVRARNRGEAQIEEARRIHKALPFTWINRATEQLQRGHMDLTRAVAQPTTF